MSDSAPVTLVKAVRAIDPSARIDARCDLLVDEHGVVLDPPRVPANATIFDGRGLWALPGLIDLQVHFREPGFEHKETLLTGSRAALAGGITTVVVMPNTRPSLDEPARVRAQRSEAERQGGVRILVAAAATRGIAGRELSDHAALKMAGAVAITDDGMPLLDDDLMERALVSCRAYDLLFMQHAEDTRLSRHAPMNASVTAEAFGIEGQPADAEGVLVERDLRLVQRTDARYHVLHTSTARSLRAIAAAKAKGLSVTCEASPHHLLLNDADCVVDGALDANRKMNPPLRDESDRRALIEALASGLVDAVATDHAPHSPEEKAHGFAHAPFGVIGLETAFAALLSLVRDGTISLARAVELMTSGPARVLRRTGRLGTFGGADAPGDVCLVDPERSWQVSPGTLQSRSKNSCFLGRTFTGRVVATFLRGRLAYQVL